MHDPNRLRAIYRKKTKWDQNDFAAAREELADFFADSPAMVHALVVRAHVESMDRLEELTVAVKVLNESSTRLADDNRRLATANHWLTVCMLSVALVGVGLAAIQLIG